MRDSLMRGAVALVSAPMLVLALANPTSVFAQVEISGFAQVNYAARITGTSCASDTACDFLLGEERVQLKLEGFSDDGSAGFKGRLDFFNDAVVGRSGTEVREIYLDLISDYVTFRAGRQIVTWGLGDLLFINDIFPKDWVAFFSGRPLQYLKIGSDALKVDFYPGFLNAEIIVIPFFEPDRYPTGARLIFPDPFPAGLLRRVETKRRSFENVEMSSKLSRYVADWEVAVYLSRTFYRLPAQSLDDSASPVEVHLRFPRLNTFGASLAGAFLDGIVNIEGAYYDSERDRDGSNAAIENSEIKGLVGYSRPIWSEATLGVQGQVERIQEYDSYKANLPVRFRARDELRWTATIRYTQPLFHQSLLLNLFVFSGISEKDGYLISSARYAFTDALWGEVGGNIFFGSDKYYSRFGSFDKNDNIYLSVRYGF
ncbi:MAG: hypothetical protein BMS9Abin05_0535 [Rhodothermia bacterium]|nr:MAG: hypothetical protein BMS9Abin05_0535 [Rhodothermia bacterium]